MPMEELCRDKVRLRPAPLCKREFRRIETVLPYVKAAPLYTQHFDPERLTLTRP